MNENKTGNSGRAEQKLMKCEDIQPLLFDYMNHELGEGRSAIAREHLRKCKDCQGVARNIQATLDLLHKASRTENRKAERLTDSRRKQIIWAFSHPIKSWIAKHMFVFSFIATVLLFISVFSFMRMMIRKHFAPKEGTMVEVKLVPQEQTSRIYGGTNTKPPGEAEVIR